MLYFLTFAAILVIDIASKIWAIGWLKPNFSVPLWKNVFHLTYVENRGAAFGIFQGGTAFFIVFTVVILALIVYVIKKYAKESKLLSLSLVFIAGGAVGNLIDRVLRGFVIDFFDFCLINFPVFNVADIFVCIGAAMLIVFVIFFDGKEKKDCGNDEN